VLSESQGAEGIEGPLLLILSGPEIGKRVGVEQELVVGRAEGVDLVVDDGEISRRHAVFRSNGGELEVEDLGSLNGTWVNGERIAVATRLSREDVVKVGKTSLQVLLSEPAEEAPPAGQEAPVGVIEGATEEGEAVPAEPEPSPVPQARALPDLLGGTHQDELRPVTALFADIVGSTGIGEQLSPDDVQTLVGECVTRMSRVVEQHGGTIDAYMGDGIAAFFGFPSAREDDAQRAARAALQIIEQIGAYAQEVRSMWSLPNFNIRVGLNTGQVGVGLVGAGNRRPVALGDTMNVAARLQSNAKPGTILAGGRTAAELHNRFLLEPLGEIVVKGRDAPVEVWRLVRAETARRSTKPRPFVGREQEREQLQSVLDALSGGRGDAVFVVGDPGIGKTRLLDWLRDLSTDQVTWLDGSCFSYTTDVSYSPFAGSVRRWLEVDEDEDAVSVRSQLEAKLAQLLGPQVGEILPYLASLLSVKAKPSMDARVRDLSSDQLAEEIRSAYCAWVRALCEQGPVVLEVEDFQWADEAARRVAESLLDVVSSAPLLLAITFRVEPDSEGWKFRERALTEYGAVELRLGPLSDAEAGELLAELAPEGLDEAVAEELTVNAEGNPLFLEHLLRLFAESGEMLQRRTWAMTVVRHELPSALEGLLVARIDALPSRARRLVQIAAVVGRSFPARLLEGVVGAEHFQEALASLLQLDILRERRPPPEREFEFTHGLLREAALSALPRARRREIYRTVAATIERTFADALEPHFEQLAFYNARAGDLPRALWYLLQAAERASAVHAYTQAAELWKRASSLAEKIGDSDAQHRVSRELWQLSEHQS
jgi:class 3 adenylate cyclase